MLSGGARHSTQEPASAPLGISDGAQNSVLLEPQSPVPQVESERPAPVNGSERRSHRISQRKSGRQSFKASGSFQKRGSSSTVQSAGAAATGSLMLTADGRLLEKNLTTDSRTVVQENQTLTGLFLGGTTGVREEDLEEELAETGEEGDVTAWEIDYFPDPPCVMPHNKNPEDDVEDEGEDSVPTYWKDHADWLNYWPSLAAQRDRNISFTRQIGAIGRTATGSNLANSTRAFVNVSHNAIGLRKEPTMDEAAKTGGVIHPGQSVFIEKTKEQDNNRFLKSKDGWVFEFSSDGEPVMIEMRSIVTGPWWYRVCCTEFVEIRSAPSYSSEARSGWVLCPHEVLVVSLRCKLDGWEFLQLADGRGWMFVMKPGVMKGNKEHHNRVMDECDNDFLERGTAMDFRGMVPATNEAVEVGYWTYVTGDRPMLALGAKKFGTYINAGDIIKVDKRAIANGDELISLHQQDDKKSQIRSSDADAQFKTTQERLWVHMIDGRGWLPVTGEDGKALLVLQDTKDLSYPSWYAGSRNQDKPEEDWMMGFV